MRGRKNKLSMRKRTLINFVSTLMLFGVGLGSTIYIYQDLVKELKSDINNDIQLKDNFKSFKASASSQLTYQQDYILTKNKKDISKFKETSDKNLKLIKDSKDLIIPYKDEVNWNLISKSYSGFNLEFAEIVNLMKIEGDSKTGLRGDLRSVAHDIESSINKYKMGPEFMVGLLTLRRREKDFLLRKDAKYLGKAKSDVVKIKSLLTQKNYKENIRNNFSASLDRYLEKFSSLVDNQVALESSMKKSLLFVESIDSVVNETIELVDRKHVEKMEMIYKSERTTLIFSCGLFLVVLLIGTIFQRNFAKSVSIIAEISTKLRKSSSVTAKYSNDMNNASTKVSSSVTQQASAIQETVATLNEISSMVNKSVENAKISSEKAGLSQDVAEEGKKAVGKMVNAIDDINGNNEAIMTEMTRSNDEIVRIVDVINEISDKTNVINDIVFQTKLLSFNASVEAARAGEHGKGFAVVAEEVGNLAQMSGNAAREIEELLSGSIIKVESIVKETQSNVEKLVGDAKESITNGVTVSEQCGQILEDVVSNVEIVTKMMSEISIASQEQAEGINNITDAMNELDEVTHTNSAVAQETASFSTSLLDQTQIMNNIVENLEEEVLGGNSLHEEVTPVSESVVEDNESVFSEDELDGLEDVDSSIAELEATDNYPSHNDNRFKEAV